MKRVYVAQDAADAELVRGVLERAGLNAVVREEIAGLPPAPFPSVWVEDSEEQEAQRILTAR